MMTAVSEERLETQHVRKLLRHGLGRQQAANLERLADTLGMDRHTILEGLMTLVEDGEVEVLRPLMSDHGTGTSVGGEGSPSVFYRLVRQTDGDYLWEQRLAQFSPAVRRSDHEQTEGRRERSRSPAREAWPQAVPVPALNWLG